MDTKPPVRLIKKVEHKATAIPPKANPTAGPKRWSRAVRSWVVEFQERDHNESLPAFETLFKNIEVQSKPGQEMG
jgi:hypothetical protein